MKCPHCGAVTRVIESRPLKGYTGRIRRRRECLICKRRFTTTVTEKVVAPPSATHSVTPSQNPHIV